MLHYRAFLLHYRARITVIGRLLHYRLVEHHCDASSRLAGHSNSGGVDHWYTKPTINRRPVYIIGHVILIVFVISISYLFHFE